VHPSPLYKGGPRGGGGHTTDPTSLGAPPPFGRCPPPSWQPTTSTSLSIPRGLPKGCSGWISHHHCTPSCYGVSGFCPTPSTSAILAGLGILEVIVIAIRVRVHRGAARVAPESLLQDLRDLEVCYVILIVNACAGE
jgi:hypothetical protein